MPFMSADCEVCIHKSHILTSHLVTPFMEFVIIVSTICTVLVIILLEIDVDCMELKVDFLSAISNNSNEVLVRQ